MSRVRSATDAAHAPVGPYSQSVRIGALVATAGQGADDPATGRLAGSHIETQARQCLPNVEAVLRGSGATFDDVLRVGVFLTRREDFDALNAAYSEVISA